MAVCKFLCQFEYGGSTVTHQRRRALKEFQTEPCHRITEMNGFAALSFEALIQVIRQQFDEEVNFIGFEGTGCDLVDGKSTLGFFDVVFHAAALVVKPPQVDRFPVQIRDDGFVLPIRVQQETRLVVLNDGCFTDDGDPPWLRPGGRLVPQGDAFNDPVFVDVTFPVPTRGHFSGQTLRPFHFAHIANLSFFPQGIEVFAAKAFVKPGILNGVLAQEAKGLFQKSRGLRGRVNVSAAEHGI